MIVQFTTGKFTAWTDAGLPAEAYKIWAYLDGTATPAISYSDALCTAANAWPVVLNARGEASIYVKVSTDFYFTLPTATDISSPIWVSYKVGYQEGLPPLLATITPGTTHNNYVGTTTPVAASIADKQMILLTPDATNADTMTSDTFTGTGVNDANFSGPYTGNTPGAVFAVQIDGVNFHGVGLSDVTWGGTPLLGHVYTVICSTAAATDKFQWRKDGGAWSAEIDMTGAAQALTDGVTVLFAATTGHTATEYWNNVNTFKWRIDAGAWTEGVAITAAAQTLQNGIKVTFAERIGHTLNDLWTQTVETPVRFNFCALGNKIVYKNEAGTLVALDGGDMVQDIPATLVYSLTQDCYILNNPSLPELSTLKPYRERIEVIAEYTIGEDDIGKEISCTGTFPLNIPACSTIPAHWWWWRNSGSGIITVTANGAEIIKSGPSTVGASTMILGPGQMVMAATNGADIHVSMQSGQFLQQTVLVSGTSFTTNAGTSKIRLRMVGGGAGAGGAAATEVGTGGGAGAYAEKVFSVSPSTAYTYAIGAAGTGGVGSSAGVAGGNTTFAVGATTVTAGGGVRGVASASGLAAGGLGGTATNGDINCNGHAGGYGIIVAGGPYLGGMGADSQFGAGGLSGLGGASGSAGLGYGAGGGGAADVGNGGAGVKGCIIVEEFS